MAAGGGTKAIVAAFFANLGIAIAKFIGFAITRSSSMLAEGIHSVADTSNQGLLLWGNRAAQRAPTQKHPFGYGRERYFWSFVVAMILFALGSAFALFEGIEKIRHPHVLESPWVAVAILVAGILLEGWSFRTAVVESRPLKRDLSWRQFVQRSRVPELPVVLLEDAGALIGLFLALGGVGLTSLTDDGIWDGIATLSIGVLLGFIAIVLAIEMKSLLIGEGATEEDHAAIIKAIKGTEGVHHLIDMKTQHVGPEDLLVAAKLGFDPSLDGSQLADVVNHTEVAIREVVPIATMIYLEHDLYRPELQDPEPQNPEHRA
jgi:cation diffusion facilitator family transporter